MPVLEIEALKKLCMSLILYTDCNYIRLLIYFKFNVYYAVGIESIFIKSKNLSSLFPYCIIQTKSNCKSCNHSDPSHDTPKFYVIFYVMQVR